MNISRAISTVSLFKDADEDLIQRLSARAHSNTYKKGKVLFIHGDKAELFYIINHGWVKLFRETLDGKQAVINILSTGEIFGENFIFGNGLYPYSAEIVESGTIISLPLSELKEEIENNKSLAIKLLQSMTTHRQKQELELEHRSTQNTAQRIGCFLLRLAPKNTNKCPIINLPYDKMLLASRLGMQPETFSRALSKLRQNTDIRIDGSSIQIDDLNKLSQYICSSCSGKFPCQD